MLCCCCFPFFLLAVLSVDMIFSPDLIIFFSNRYARSVDLKEFRLSNLSSCGNFFVFCFVVVVVVVVVVVHAPLTVRT